MEKKFRNWFIVGIVISGLTLFLLINGLIYFSELKEQAFKAEEKSQQLQTQLNEKSQQITAKEQELAQKDGEITNLKSQNSGLTNDIEKNEKELSRRLGEVKKLQGSLKTVGGCLVGTIGVIEAFKQNDGDLARKSAFLIEATCQEAGKIIKEVEGFSTNSQSAQY